MRELNDEMVKRFFAFVKERHAIYIRRNRGDEWPWTDDEILQTYKFTNCFREMDTGTVYCREAIREPYADHTELFFNIASYRLYNLIESHKAIGFTEKYDAEAVKTIMYIRQKHGERIFTGAHMITGTLGGDKIHQVFGLCLGTLWENRRKLEPKPGDTLESAFNRLNKHNPGYGPFIAYEVISDLRWTRYLENASDIMTWANPGPGAQQGLIRLLGITPYINRKGMKTADTRKLYPKRDECIELMRHLREMSDDMTPKWVPTMEMRDIEHSLCEFSKYDKVRLGQGKTRALYTPPHMKL